MYMKEYLWYHHNEILLVTMEDKTVISLSGMDEHLGFLPSENHPFGTHTSAYLERAARMHQTSINGVCEILYHCSRLDKPLLMRV